MKNPLRLFALLLALLALAACSASVPEDERTAGPQDHNAADTMFAQMMMVHHRQAVEMSEIVLAHGELLDPQFADLARSIAKAQAPEIEQMRQWLEHWGEPQTSDHAGHMDGMLSEDSITRLREADAAQAQRLYLSGMIEHHRGAIDMAQDELDHGLNAPALDLARQIADSQSGEIEKMQAMLERLG